MNTQNEQPSPPVHPTHGPFIKEGLMVAFPLCFPGITDPIPLEESRITALTLASSGVLYGGTSGKGSHLLAASFKGATGLVWDLGVIEGATACAGIACGKERLAAAINGPGGHRIVFRKTETVPESDLLQEWSFIRRPYEDATWSVAGERMLDLVGLADTPLAVGISEHHLFLVDIDQGRCEIVVDIDSASHLMVNATGDVYGLDAGNTLWTFNPASRKLIRHAVSLPAGAWGKGPLVWAYDAGNANFYLVDSDGRIFSFSPGSQICQFVAQAPLYPVHCLAVIPDGRVYGFCGEGIAHLFVVDPETSGLRDLGVAISVLERRRYGYQFAAAVVNPDGHLIFGENDNLGHLWMYFPTIPPKNVPGKSKSDAGQPI